MQNSATVPNLASVRNLDEASGHRAIKIKKLRILFTLNSVKAKLKQTTAVANYRTATHTIVKAAKTTRYKNAQLVAHHEQICLMKNEHQSQNLLLRVDPRSTFRNNFLQFATNRTKDQQTFLLRDALVTQGEKREIST